MKKQLLFLLCVFVAGQALAQVPTETELGSPKTSTANRPGYYFYAKPFEVTMTVNLWGEVPQQGVYVIPTNTDIIQLISFAGGPSSRSNLDDVLLYRVSSKKDAKTKIILNINLRDILEGKSPTVPLAPGDMIVVKRLSETLTWQDALTIVNAASAVTILGITIYNLRK